MDKNLKEEIDNLFNYIESSKLYKDLLECKKQLEDNKEIEDLIKEIKRLQKIAVNNKDEVLEKEIKKSYDKLYSYPVYQSYIDLKDELVSNLRIVSDTISNYFYEVLKLDIKD